MSVRDDPFSILGSENFGAKIDAETISHRGAPNLGYEGRDVFIRCFRGWRHEG